MRYVIVGEEYIEKRETSVGLYVSFLLFIQGLTSNICSSPKAPEILYMCVYVICGKKYNAFWKREGKIEYMLKWFLL